MHSTIELLLAAIIGGLVGFLLGNARSQMANVAVRELVALTLSYSPESAWAKTFPHMYALFQRMAALAKEHE